MTKSSKFNSSHLLKSCISMQLTAYVSDKFELKYHNIFESFDFFLWRSVLIQFLLYGLCYCWKRTERQTTQDLSKSTNTLHAAAPVSFSAIDDFKFSIHCDLIPTSRILELFDNKHFRLNFHPTSIHKFPCIEKLNWEVNHSKFISTQAST